MQVQQMHLKTPKIQSEIPTTPYNYSYHTPSVLTVTFNLEKQDGTRVDNDRVKIQNGEIGTMVFRIVRRISIGSDVNFGVGGSDPRIAFSRAVAATGA